MNKENNFLTRFKANKKAQLILIIALSLILIFGIIINGQLKTEGQESDTVLEYVKNTEAKIEKLLSKVGGAGNVSVAITVESGMETVLAVSTTVKETSSGKETVSAPIIVNGKTVVLKEKYPKITGVLIVAEGADKISVRTKIQQAVVSLLDINVNCIEILTMK